MTGLDIPTALLVVAVGLFAVVLLAFTDHPDPHHGGRHE